MAASFFRGKVTKKVEHCALKRVKQVFFVEELLIYAKVYYFCTRNKNRKAFAMTNNMMGIPMESRYVNPYTDFGFKLLFGTVANKELLIDFLNSLLSLADPIKDITYKNVEQLGDTANSRKAVFDVYCESEKGDRFIVEMQKAEQNYFIDRSIYYASFPIREQAERGMEWNFKLTKVYTVGILDFTFDHTNEYYHHEVMLIDRKTKKVFYDKLVFVYLEMPKFHKDISECETFLDKWMFVLKNMTRLLERPAELQNRVFKRLFEAAEVAKFSPTQKAAYEESLKVYRDIVNVVDTAHEKGIAEGMERGIEKGKTEEKLSIAKNMKSLGLPTEQIMQITCLTADDINRL